MLVLKWKMPVSDFPYKDELIFLKQIIINFIK